MKTKLNEKLADDENINEHQKENAGTSSKPKGSMLIDLGLDESPDSRRIRQKIYKVLKMREEE